MYLTDDARPQTPTPLMMEERDGLYLLLHPQKPLWTAVNRLGVEIATLCDGKHTLQDIATHLSHRYGRDPETVRADVVAYLEALHRAGFLQPGDRDAHRPASERATGLTHLHVAITQACNLRCIHCAVEPGAGSDNPLSSREICRLIDEVEPGAGGSITISGGEPLLRDDCLDLLRHASDRARTYLVTNGTLIDARTAAALAELDLTIQVSLDGSGPGVHDRIRGRGAFERTMRAVKMLRQQGFGGSLTFNMTAMRLNVDDVPGVIALAEQAGADLYVAPLLKAGHARTAWAELSLTPQEHARLYTSIYRTLPNSGRAVRVEAGLQGFHPNPQDAPREPWCTIGRGAAVDSSGNVYPCPLLMEQAFYLGHVRETSLGDIIASPTLQALRRLCANRVTTVEECRRCHWRGFCQAACPASVFLEKGTLLATDGLCELRQHLYRETFFDLVPRSKPGKS